MEEILASIRKIIADDQVFPLSARQPAEPAAVDEEPHDPESSWDQADARSQNASQSESHARADASRAARPDAVRRFEHHDGRDQQPSANPVAQSDVRRPADPPATRQPANFHSGLASIFSNDRPPSRAEEARPASPAPQLVAKAPGVSRDAQAAVVLPIDGDRARPIQNDVWAESRKQQAAPVQDNRPLQSADPEDYDESPMRRDIHSGEPALRGTGSQHGDPSERRRSDPSAAPQLRADAARVSAPRPVGLQHQADTAANQSRDADAARRHGSGSADERLLSERADASITSAFRSLATTVTMPEPEAIESITRELLRPMLKQWLDDNLPVMVEKLVRAEIERVARGSR